VEARIMNRAEVVDFVHLNHPTGAVNFAISGRTLVVKNGVGDFTLTFREPVKEQDTAFLPAFNQDTAAGNVNVFVSHTSDTVKQIHIRQGAAGTLVDLHVDLLVVHPRLT
jgi:phospholipase/lecithinase/hemolysin